MDVHFVGTVERLNASIAAIGGGRPIQIAVESRANSMKSEHLPEPQIHPLMPPADVAAAIRKWKANCGPVALAAATGRTMDEVRVALSRGTGRFKGYTNVPDIHGALRWLDVKVVRTWSKPTNALLTMGLQEGPAIFMLEWGGPWTRDPRAAAKHRHLIAFRYGWIGQKMGPRWVGDATIPNVWCLLDAWLAIVHELQPEGGDGTWSIGWACQLAEPASRLVTGTDHS